MDQRKDERIDFVGVFVVLENWKSGWTREMAIAFALYPVSMNELLEVADAGKIMPPKSTWFEPKLRVDCLFTSLIKNDRNAFA